MRYPKRPLLPGNTANFNVGRTRFHKSHHLDFVVPGVPYISEKELPGIGGLPLPGNESQKKQSIYAIGEIIKLPPWLVFDKHVLAFDSYYLEPTEASVDYNVIVHHCKIYFFLEDGCIKVVEHNKPYNDGVGSGCIINRQRIRYPNEAAEGFYDILDLNIGNTVEFYGKIFKIIDCDEFTRKFLNRLGISVPDKMPAPEDPYLKQIKEKEQTSGVRTKVNKKMTLNEYLSDHNRKLTFKAFWDDRENANGFVHLLLVFYYLVDDTIEIKDVTDKENVLNISKRGKLPMDTHYGYEQPGASEPHTVLNALRGPQGQRRYIVDPLDIGRDQRPHYLDKDLRIGTVICVFGRKLVIYDCDEFTRDYYKTKFGLERHEAIERPPTKDELIKYDKQIELKVPPYNGFGTYEDSLINCLKLHYGGTIKSDLKFLQKDKIGYDCRILRFVARYIYKNQPTNRIFVISYFLRDDNIAVFEEVQPNSGTRGGMFIRKRKVLKPGEKLITTRSPEYYTYDDLYLGNTVCFDEFNFNIFASDEYTLKYMETHPNEFPKSNIKLIMNKVIENVKPVYKSFVATFMEGNEFPPTAFGKFRDAIKTVMGDKITEHEILTIARFYSLTIKKDRFSLDTLRMYTHDELRKSLYDDFDRLRECFLHYDGNKCGYVSKGEAYTILRSCRLPLDVEHLRVILENFGKGDKCDIVYEELLHFLNYKCEPLTKHIEPINIQAEMSWLNMCRPVGKSIVSCVDIDRMIKDLDLEKDLLNQYK